ncbi:MAG TPA: hypothetical protein VJT31_23855 [Rugosimonospora sp.]|nr:hypothetical protein [Rugosimonospora sp.]
MNCATCPQRPGQPCCQAVLARVTAVVGRVEPVRTLSPFDSTVRATIAAVAGELDSIANHPHTPADHPRALSDAATLLRQAAGLPVRHRGRPTPRTATVDDATVVDRLCSLLNQGASGADVVEEACTLMLHAGRPLIDSDGYEVDAHTTIGSHGLTVGEVTIGDTTVSVYQDTIEPYGVIVHIDPAGEHAADLTVDVGDVTIYGQN